MSFTDEAEEAIRSLGICECGKTYTTLILGEIDYWHCGDCGIAHRKSLTPQCTYKDCTRPVDIMDSKYCHKHRPNK